jgi:hypothetical protein
MSDCVTSTLLNASDSKATVSDAPGTGEKRAGKYLAFRPGNEDRGLHTPRIGKTKKLVSDGGNYMVLSTPGFQGHLIAECRFKAVEVAFVSDLIPGQSADFWRAPT